MIIEWIGFVAGILIVLSVFASVIGTLVVPRAVRLRIARVAMVLIRGGYDVFANLGTGYMWRDRILAWQGPMALLFMLFEWVLLLVFGFALIFWPSTGSFGSALMVAGSSIFTLGMFAPAHGWPVAASFAAAGAGLIIVALVIAYLPVLYTAFNRREALVTLLDSSGQPSWGPEILARTALNDSRGAMGEFYGRWLVWTADVAESHTTYPVLIFMRSPQPLRSWVTGLLAVMDCAALESSLAPLSVAHNVRPFLNMGHAAFESALAALSAPKSDHTSHVGPGITREEFDAAVAMIEDAGWESEVPRDEAWERFCGWRETYAGAAMRLADLVYAPPALWSGTRTRYRQPPAAMRPWRDPDVEAELRRVAELRAR